MHSNDWAFFQRTLKTAKSCTALHFAAARAKPKSRSIWHLHAQFGQLGSKRIAALCSFGCSIYSGLDRFGTLVSHGFDQVMFFGCISCRPAVGSYQFGMVSGVSHNDLHIEQQRALSRFAPLALVSTLQKSQGRTRLSGIATRLAYAASTAAQTAFAQMRHQNDIHRSQHRDTSWC
ncbi:hypothetical protein IB213_11150 [Comamonas sp. CMM02]|nr:hypothetical protein [Comamonas sp. CMM02]